jgi:hypothetical protein
VFLVFAAGWCLGGLSMIAYGVLTFGRNVD